MNQHGRYLKGGIDKNWGDACNESSLLATLLRHKEQVCKNLAGESGLGCAVFEVDMDYLHGDVIQRPSSKKTPHMSFML